MPSLEERVAYLEGRFGEHAVSTAALRDDIIVLRGDMNRRFEDLQGDMNRRFAAVDRRFDDLHRDVKSIDDKGDRRFTWLVGLLMSGFIAVFSALIGLYFK